MDDDARAGSEPLLVPISVAASQQRAEDGTCSQWVVEAFAFSLLEPSTGRQLSRRSLAPSSDGCSLAEAVQQVEADLAGRKCTLLSLGPLPLRQYLHPAALQAKLKLADHFGAYVDLSKELARRLKRQQTQKANSTGSRRASSPSSSTWSSGSCESPCCSPLAAAESNSASDCSSTGYASLELEQESSQDCCYCLQYYYAPDCSAADFAPADGLHFYSESRQQQRELQRQQPKRPEEAVARHKQQVSAVSAEEQLRLSSEQLGEMLESLSIASPRQSDAAADAEAEEACDRCEKCQALASEPSASSGDGGPVKQDAKEGAIERERHHCLACLRRLNGCLVDSMGELAKRLIEEGRQFKRLERIKRRVEVGLCNHDAGSDQHRVVRARGLPWQATEQDIADFFVGLNIAKGGIGLCLSRQGRRNGEALIQFEGREQRRLALARHKHFMGARYIEVYRASSEDFLSVAVGYNNRAQAFLSRGAQVIVRMRGLPFSCTAQQVLDFFAGPAKQRADQRCEVLDGEDGILFVKNQDDKPTGDAFVLFASEEQSQRALQKHRQNIGARYVELFRSTISEVQQVLSICMDSGGQQNPHSHSQQQVAKTTSVPAGTKQQHRQPWTQKQSSPGVTYAQVATSGSQQAAADEPAPEKRPDEPAKGAPSSPESSPAAAETGQTAAGSDTSAFDNNSVNSSPSSAASQVGDAPAAAEQLAPSPSAQSPVSTLSAASTASSSYKSSQYGGQRPHHQRHGASGGAYYRNQHHYYPAGQQQAHYGYLPSPHHQHHHQHHHHSHHHQQQQHYHPMQMAPAAYPQSYQHQFPAYAHPFHYPMYPAAPALAAQQQVRDCVRLRGLPFEAQVEDVLYFLGEHSKSIVYQGVHMVYSAQGQPSGEAIIQMSSGPAAATAAQEFHRKVMSVGKKQRYIEVIPCSSDDLNLMLGAGRSLAAGPPALLAAGHPRGPLVVPAGQPVPELVEPAAQPSKEPADRAGPPAAGPVPVPAYYSVLYYYPQQPMMAPAAPYH